MEIRNFSWGSKKWLEFVLAVINNRYNTQRANRTNTNHLYIKKLQFDVEVPLLSFVVILYPISLLFFYALSYYLSRRDIKIPKGHGGRANYVGSRAETVIKS